MKNCLLLTSFIFSLNSVIAQSDSGSFYLHKFAQNIGRESYTLSRSGNEQTYDINFKFVDRGSPVPLKAQLVTKKDLEPVSLFIKGNTSRFSAINDSIRIDNKKAFIRVDDSSRTEAVKQPAFPVGGYSPGTVQMVLLQYWKKHGEPQTLPLLPKGEVSISRQGRDTVVNNNQAVILNRYILSGLVWGNEIIWTDEKDGLVCLITNDAEGDKLEMMRTDLEPLLPTLLSRAATIGMNLFSSSVKADTAKNKVLAIIGADMIDVLGSAVIKSVDIIIEADTIRKVAYSGSFLIPANATVIHAEGKIIMPGLWDMHAHFEQAEWGPAYLAAGVTTVRDCGNEFEYINAVKKVIDSHRGIGPTILKAGIVDGPGPMGLGIVRASNKEEAVKVVNMYKNNGFVQIKIYSSVQPDVLRAITNEAHRLGLTVTGHIPQGMTTKAAIDSGMDQVNHMQYIYAMMKKKADKSVDLQDTSNQDVLSYLRIHNTVVDPTIGVFEMIFRSVKDNILDMEPNYYTLPVPLQALFTNMGMEPDQAKANKPRMQAMMNLVKALYDKGIPVVAGTDMGFPGYSLARELELYVQAGLSPMEAIQSATIVPAQVMHMEKQAGVIREGRAADLLILNADPLTNIRNIRNVWKVVKQGQVYDPVVLHKMAGFLQ